MILRLALASNALAALLWAACYVTSGELFWLVGFAVFLSVACAYVYAIGYRR